jgi:hypothetical protein
VFVPPDASPPFVPASPPSPAAELPAAELPELPPPLDLGVGESSSEHAPAETHESAMPTKALSVAFLVRVTLSNIDIQQP